MAALHRETSPLDDLSGDLHAGNRTFLLLLDNKKLSLFWWCGPAAVWFYLGLLRLPLTPCIHWSHERLLIPSAPSSSRVSPRLRHPALPFTRMNSHRRGYSLLMPVAGANCSSGTPGNGHRIVLACCWRERSGASARVGIPTYLSPVVGIIGGNLWFNEEMSWHRRHGRGMILRRLPARRQASCLSCR